MKTDAIDKGAAGRPGARRRRAHAAPRIAGATTTTTNFVPSVTTATTATKATNGIARRIRRRQQAAEPRGKAGTVDPTHRKYIGLATAVSKVGVGDVQIVGRGAARIDRRGRTIDWETVGHVDADGIASRRIPTRTTTTGSNNERRNHGRIVPEISKEARETTAARPRRAEATVHIKTTLTNDNISRNIDKIAQSLTSHTEARATAANLFAPQRGTVVTAASATDID